MPSMKEATVGYTVMRNKLHLDIAGIDTTGTPKCGQGRIVETVFHADDLLSMFTASQIVTGYALASKLPLCGRCFKKVQ